MTDQRQRPLDQPRRPGVWLAGSLALAAVLAGGALVQAHDASPASSPAAIDSAGWTSTWTTPATGPSWI